MERNFDVGIYIGEENARKLGIDEETSFMAYYADGEIYITIIEDKEEDSYEDIKSRYDEDLDDEDDDYIECTEDDCEDCEYHCPYCGNCIIDESEDEI